MEITDHNLDLFRADFKEAVRDLENKYDVTIKLGRITYDENQFYARMTVDNGQDPDLIEEHNFDSEVWKFEDIGLKEGMYRQMFLNRKGERYAILGFVPNAKKYPLRVVRFSDGKRFHVSRYFIKEFIPGKYYENRKDEKE